MAAKRKHRRTGKKPPGGARPGAGRPEGSTNALGMGEVKAIRACNWQVPPEAPEDLRALADRAVQRIADVMEEKVWSGNAANVLGAATRVRELVCGPIKQKHEVTGADGGALTIEIRKYTTEGEACPQTKTLPEAPLEAPTDSQQ